MLKLLLPDAVTHDRPDRTAPRKTKKAGDFPVLRPDDPGTIKVQRTITFYPLDPHR